MKLPWLKSHNEKIFINYRREDALGFAGRLSDSLAGYFGRQRVFRDVTDIDYGDDFERVIDEKLDESGAVVVLIGKQWVNIQGEDGGRRLDDARDHVCREISAALQKEELSVVPVLIGGAAMPRTEDLPETLHGLPKRNAISLTDERWETDVARLAKVLSIDVPSSIAQRRLDLAKWVSLLALIATAFYSTYAFIFAVDGLWSLQRELTLGDLKERYHPIKAAIPFMACIVVGLVAVLVAPLMEASKRLYAWAMIFFASLGTIVPFAYYAVRNEQLPDWSLIGTYGASMMLVISMLCLMVLARYKAE